LAAEANVVAPKALAKAQADLVIITNADAAAAKGAMNGDDIQTAVHAVFIAAPGQACTRTGIKDKAQGLAFLSALPAAWIALLAPARVACTAAIVAATAGLADAAALAAAAVADHQPPAAPSVVPTGAVTAADVDVGSMTEVERRALMAKLVPAMENGAAAAAAAAAAPVE